MSKKQFLVEILVCCLVGLLVLAPSFAAAQDESSLLTQLTHNDVNDTAGEWSPDGTQIAFVSNRDGDLDLYVMNVDGSHLVQITNDDSTDVAPRWSPDGTQILFMSDRDGDAELYVIDVDGSHLVQLTDNACSDHSPDWSPDGRQILFASWCTGNSELYVMDADGSNVVQLTNNAWGYSGGRWSPDGTQIVVSSERDGDRELYLMNADGSNIAKLTDNTRYDQVGSWSPDGTKISYHSDAANVADCSSCGYELFVIDLVSFDTAQITHNAIPDLYPKWSPDGTQILFTAGYDGEEELFLLDYSAWLKDAEWVTIPCEANADNTVNLRAGPTTAADRAGTLNPGDVHVIDGQAVDADGFVWWHLEIDAWVRSDVVRTSGICIAVPVLDE